MDMNTTPYCAFAAKLQGPRHVQAARKASVTFCSVTVLLIVLGACRFPSAHLAAEETERLPGYHQINEKISAALRKVSLAENDIDVAESVFDLAELHREVVADPRFRQSRVLQGYRRRIAAKLKQAERDIIRELKKRGDVPSLAPAKQEELLESEAVGRMVSDQLTLVGSTLGGPSRLLDEVAQRGGFGGRPIPDFGWDLVRLIQSTIAPDAWDVNGGGATIIYYRPLFLLVVRAPLELQDDVGGVLGKLRE